GTMMDADHIAALQSYARNGGGFVGIHCAATALRDEPWYGRLIGTVSSHHPDPQQGIVRLERAIAELWLLLDKWYKFTGNPGAWDVDVVFTVNEKTCQGGKHDDDQPVAWCRAFEGGR
ncbi:ThuA-like domain-containing protein, partial [Pseudomassariella vexata]